jgi:hypothetical protein
MTHKKWLVVPDFVTSKTDGQRHFINGQKLMELYGVDPEECIVVAHPTLTNGYDLEKLLILSPRYDGNYTLPERL